MMNSRQNKLFILNGSPVRESSVDIVSEEIARGAAENGWTSETVYLNDFIITPCQSCGVREDDDVCIYHDGIYPVYEKFNDCDAVIAASPIYFDCVSAQLKLFIDRCNCYRPLKQSETGEHYLKELRWKKRKGIIVLVGGSRQRYNCALTVVKGFFIWTGVQFIDSILYSHDGWEKSAAKNDAEILKTAFQLGRSF